MVQPRVFQDCRCTDDGTGLGLARGKHQALNPGMDQGAATHGAGLQRYKQSSAGQSIVTAGQSGHLQYPDFGMGGCIAAADLGVTGRRKYVAPRTDQNGAHRHFTPVTSVPGLTKGTGHVIPIIQHVRSPEPIVPNSAVSAGVACSASPGAIKKPRGTAHGVFCQASTWLQQRLNSPWRLGAPSLLQ